MTNFFSTFAACFTAIILFWLILQIMESRIPVSALLRDRKYYYLSFIHGKAVNMLLDGMDEKSVLEELKLFNFPFTIYPDKRCLEDINYIRELMVNEDLVKRYLLRRDFDYNDFRRLCREFGSPMEDRRRAAQMALWKITPNPNDKRVESMANLLVELMTPPFIGSDEGSSISAGENESTVFCAALAAKAIDCTKEAFANCIWKLKQVHDGIDVVKGVSGLSNHANKRLNAAIYEQFKSRFEAILEEN